MSVLKPKFSFKNFFRTAFLAFFFILSSFLTLPVAAAPERTPDPVESPQSTQTQTQTQTQQTQTLTRTPDNTDTNTNTNTETTSDDSEDICSSQTGAIGWLVCPTTGFIAKAIDGIYAVTESALVVAPLSSDSSSPIYLVWSYFRNVTNVVFIIFILVIIISQLTGLGISNYGIKKTLPKIVVTAILVNLSWIICALAVDVSNIIGASLRDLFTSIEEQTISASTISDAANVSFGSLIGVLTGAGALTIGTILISANVGIFYMLIPVLLGALIAVASGLLTIAMRQALVALLIMISPLAFVCFLLPNTENWFKKWKELLTQMLIFYPMFSALFGASELAGWVLIASAKDAFTVILGIAVQVFPLIFSWSLMKMSNTVLGKVNAGLRNLTAPAQKSATAYATRKRDLANARYLGVDAKKYNLPRRTAQWLNKNKNRDLNDTKTYEAAITNRGLAASATYKNRRGKVTGRGEALFSLVNQNLSNQEIIERGKNDFNKGISEYAKGTHRFKRLERTDIKTMNAADNLNIELARGEMINLENATSRHNRFEAALSAHSQLTLDKPGYRYTPDQVDIDRYNTISGIMEGKGEFIHYAGAYAANAHAVQDKIIDSKFANYFDSIAPTQEVVNRLTDLTNYHKSNDYIDSIVMGMKTLNMRGDTDLVKATIDQILVDDQIKLGTHASQTLANFLMFDVKDNDPFLRRYGKYINLETAAVYNEGGKRTNHNLSFNEYIRGEYPEIDPETGKAKRDADGNIIYSKVKPKRDLVKLMEGTSFDGVERTAYENMDKSMRDAYIREDGTLDEAAWSKRRKDVQNSILPAIISAGLKYPSGSEQIQSLASYMTGYKVNRDGKLVPRWKDEGDTFYGVDPKEFFQTQTDIFLGAQTPSQILGIRTDLLNPIIETLADERIDELKASGELPENYETSEEYTSLSDKEKADLRFQYAKDRLFNLLDSKGKLEQIYTSRRSGAGLGSKDKVRDLLDLDDDYKISKYREKKSEERRKLREKIEAKLRAEGHDVDCDSVHPSLSYDNSSYFSGMLDELYNQNPDSEQFYAESYKLLRKFSLDFIASKYQEFHKNNESADNYELLSYLFELLENPDNYI